MFPLHPTTRNVFEKAPTRRSNPNRKMFFSAKTTLTVTAKRSLINLACKDNVPNIYAITNTAPTATSLLPCAKKNSSLLPITNKMEILLPVGL